MTTHAFSVDVEDWFQGIDMPVAAWSAQPDRLDRGLDALLDLLDAAGVTATFFVLGWVAEHRPDVVRRLAAEGHEIGSHGWCHEKLYDLEPDRFRREEADVKSRLEDLAGSAVLGFRAPFFSLTLDSLWACDVLAELGYRYDCSISPVVTWRYGIEGAPEGIYRFKENELIEFTISTWRLAGRQLGAGGAYFRLFPSFLTRRPFVRGDQTGEAGMFYVHPWEYDPGHPVVAMERKARFTHYHNLRVTAGRTARLLAKHQFSSIGNVIDEAVKSGSVAAVSLGELSGSCG
jgi:polysaccharide deacetylase family protein (PEP-CTERM system associated)